MTASASVPPAVIIERHNREQLRLEVGHHQHATFVDLRRWVLRADGRFYPTRQGVTVAPRHLTALIEGLERLRAELQAARPGGTER